MREESIFQTVADKGNSEELEEKGPIYCEDNPWLGKGYYFWDSLIENAEWWGKTHYHGKYMIFSSSYDAHSDVLFDLVGNLKHLQYLNKFAQGLREKLGLRSIKVATVIEFMKKENLFPFLAIRAEGRNSKKVFGNINLYFDEKGAYYQPILPKVQICLVVFDKFHIADFKFVKK